MPSRAQPYHKQASTPAHTLGEWLASDAIKEYYKVANYQYQLAKALFHLKEKRRD